MQLTRNRLLMLTLVVTGVIAVTLGLSGSVPAQQAGMKTPKQTKAAAAVPPVSAAQDTSKADRLKNVRAEILRAKSGLMKEGKYKCCVAPACDWCLLTEERCDCMANLHAEKEVCPGCGLGWHNGQGTMKNFDKSKVKWSITHSHGEEHQEREKEQEHKH